MSSIGYYRYKTLADSEKTVNWTVNFVNVASKTIIPIEACAGSVILKYLDSDGQCRFFPFNKYYRTFDNPQLIGTTNKFITNILTDHSSKQNIGYKNERKMELTADVSDEELEKLMYIYTSPRVYLYIGSGVSDIESDWLEVIINVSDAVIKRRKRVSGRISLTVILPEHFSVAMI